MSGNTLVLIVVLALLQPAPQLRLQATTTRTEFLAGERVTIDAYLFNDGDAPASGTVTIAAPAGFEALTHATASGEIAPGRALSLHTTYRVVATPGLYTFVVAGGGRNADVTIRVGPVVAPRAQGPGVRVYLAAIRR